MGSSQEDTEVSKYAYRLTQDWVSLKDLGYLISVLRVVFHHKWFYGLSSVGLWWANVWHVWQNYPTCERLWCTNKTDSPSSGCRTQHMPWADGTRCAEAKVGHSSSSNCFLNTFWLVVLLTELMRYVLNTSNRRMRPSFLAVVLTMASQRNISFWSIWYILFMDFDSEHKDDDLDDGWMLDSR